MYFWFHIDCIMPDAAPPTPPQCLDRLANTSRLFLSVYHCQPTTLPCYRIGVPSRQTREMGAHSCPPRSKTSLSTLIHPQHMFRPHSQLLIHCFTRPTYRIRPIREKEETTLTSPLPSAVRSFVSLGEGVWVCCCATRDALLRPILISAISAFLRSLSLHVVVCLADWAVRCLFVSHSCLLIYYRRKTDLTHPLYISRQPHLAQYSLHSSLHFSPATLSSLLSR